MPATSTLLTVVVLVIALVAVVAFSFATQNIRYLYLQQLERRIERSYEVITAGAWYSDTHGIVEIKNIGGRGVFIKSVKLTIGYIVIYEEDGENKTTAGSYNKVFSNIHLSPLQKKILVFDLTKDVSITYEQVQKIYINYLAIIVATEKNVFIYDPAPPAESTIIEINRNDVGKTLAVRMPSGDVATFSVYEYLVCSIGVPSRFSSWVHKVEASKVLIATSPDLQDVKETFLNYGYDYDTNSFPDIDIDIEPEKTYSLTDGSEVRVTVCRIYSEDLRIDGYDVTVSRGVILVGTDLFGLDVVTFSFAGNPYPKYYSPNELEGGERGNVAVVNGKSNAFTVKIPLPDSDITALDFLSPQITPYAVSGIQSKRLVINVGSYYSQSVIVGQAFTAHLVGRGNEVYLHVGFEDPYPILVVISPPPLEVVS